MLAAGVVILISAEFYAKRPAEPPLVWHETDRDVPRAASVVALGPAGDIERPPKFIAWHGYSNAAFYRVRLMEVDRTELWRADTPGLAAPIPKEVQAKMIAGKTLLWDVTARNASGAEIASSGVQRFRVAPGSTR